MNNRKVFLILVILLMCSCENNQKKESFVKQEVNVSCIEEKDMLQFQNIKIANIDKLKTKAKARDKRLMLIIYNYSNNKNLEESTYWEQKLAEVGEVFIQVGFVNLANGEQKYKLFNKLVKKWHFEDYVNLKEPYTQKDIQMLENKAKKGNLVAMYMLQNYYNYDHRDIKKGFFWLEEMAKMGQVQAQIELIGSSFLYLEKLNNKQMEIVKKYHLEYFYFLHYSDNGIKFSHKGLVEYRDDDPKGVFFDENGSVINFE
ncbi:MAG: hypothetical protein KU29_13850 [Sulfurovum sp. FS06-10]|nr:MAG: hypothetical protein KU29_13850 [Sulfurovum sp. FS06-10]